MGYWIAEEQFQISKQRIAPFWCRDLKESPEREVA